MEGAAVNRHRLLGIPLDFPADRDLEAFASPQDRDRNRQICFLSLEGFRRARARGEYGSMIASADLVLPVSPSLVRIARRDGAAGARCYDSLRVLVTLLLALERRGGSAYLAGADRNTLNKAESNLKATFPSLRVVGRYTGKWTPESSHAAYEAIRKATPDILVAGAGLPGGELWIPRSMPEFRSGLFLWEDRILHTLAGRNRQVGQEREGMPPSSLHEFVDTPSSPLRLFALGSILCTASLKRRRAD